MDAVGFIRTKAAGEKHPQGEIARFIAALTRGEIPEYQVAAWLMAVKHKGLLPEETAELTRAMAASGRRLNWRIRGAAPTVDKHSTGGEGDKITLVLVPVLIACGLRVPTIAGRALGFTGGTIDKLESIPGFRTALDEDRFRQVVKTAGGAIIGQSVSIAPADGILYSLRDATATVESIPLITSSIVSKKAAEGVEHIVYDVKTGSGAFMSQTKDAVVLADSLVTVSRDLGMDARALVTNMFEPLGYAAGNAVEVAESVAILRSETGLRSSRVIELTLKLASELIQMAGIDKAASARARASRALKSGAAFECFEKMVNAQGGSTSWMNKPWSLVPSHRKYVWTAPQAGYVNWIATWKFGEALRLLGAGRAIRTDRIVPAAGALVNAGQGDKVEKGQPVIEFHYASKARLAEALEAFAGALAISPKLAKPQPLVLKRIV